MSWAARSYPELTPNAWLPAPGPRPSRLSLAFPFSPRCSTVSTLSVRSSRAARRRTPVRSQGQGTSTPLLSSSTLTHRGHPAPAHYRRVRAPTRAHPTNRTNKAGRGCSATLVGLDGAVSSPVPGRNRPGCRTHSNQVFSIRGLKGACVLPVPQAVSRGRKWVSILQAHHQPLPLI